MITNELIPDVPLHSLNLIIEKVKKGGQRFAILIKWISNYLEKSKTLRSKQKTLNKRRAKFGIKKKELINTKLSDSNILLLQN